MKQHIEELDTVYYSPDIVKVFKSRGMLYVVRVSRMGELSIALEILVIKHGNKRLLGRTRRV